MFIFFFLLEGYREESDQYNLIQFIFLLRLYGASTDSGKLKITDLQNFFLEVYIQVLCIQPIHERMESLRLLSRMKCFIVKFSTKKGTIPNKIIDEILEDLIPEYVSNSSSAKKKQQQLQGKETFSMLGEETEVSIDLIEEFFLQLCSMMSSSSSNTPFSPGSVHSQSNPQEKTVRRIRNFLKILLEYFYLSIDEHNFLQTTTLPLQEIKDMLISLLSYRQLQKKIQVRNKLKLFSSFSIRLLFCPFILDMVTSSTRYFLHDHEWSQYQCRVDQ
jgi:hypothetical protein